MIRTPREALADAIRDLVVAVESAGDAAGWNFAPDGPAATDWLWNEQPSGWGDQPLQDAYRTGAILWYVVAEQARAVADLLDTGRTLGLLSASRSLAEAAARCGLLLRSEMAPGDRVRRMINERLFALHEDWRFASDVPQIDDSWQMVTSNRMIDVAEAEFQLRASRPTDRAAGWVGERRESTMTVLGDIIRHPTLAAMFYRNTSAISHAALHGVVKRLNIQTDDGGEYRARLREVTTTEAVSEITAALAALAIAARALLLQSGWQLAEFDAADQTFQSIIQTLIN